MFDRCDYSYHQPTKVFKSRNEAAVMQFEPCSKKLIDIAQNAPDTVILAEDEAKVYLQASTMAVWAPRGQALTVRCDPGRAYANFYGTLNLKTDHEIVTRAETMNAEASIVHLQTILDAHPDVEILLLWDRAPYHRGPAIRAVWEANPRLEIMEFPTAAPDLNPQEQVWRATRRRSVTTIPRAACRLSPTG